MKGSMHTEGPTFLGAEKLKKRFKYTEALKGASLDIYQRQILATRVTYCTVKVVACLFIRNSVTSVHGCHGLRIHS